MAAKKKAAKKSSKKVKAEVPSTTGSNGTEQSKASGTKPGQDNKGRFTAGNKFGKGNPDAKKMYEFRMRMLSRVTFVEFYDIIDSLINEAKGGDVFAIREILDRLIGKADAWSKLVELSQLADEMALIRTKLDAIGVDLGQGPSLHRELRIGKVDENGVHDS